MSAVSGRIADYKKGVVDFLLDSKALRIEGDTTLKSGRESPYFLNAGGFDTGSTIGEIGRAFAGALADSKNLGGNFDIIYGIPEKGVSLAPVIASELAREPYKMDRGWFFTRKFGKGYGEATGISSAEYAKSMVVGRIPAKGDRIVVIDDVLTTGGAKYEALRELNKIVENPNIVGLFIIMDRQEVGIDGVNAITKFTEDTKIPVFPIVLSTEALSYLYSRSGQNDFVHQANLDRVARYLRAYGTADAQRITRPDAYARIINEDRSVIIAADMPTIEKFEDIVRETHSIEGISGYKVGFELVLYYGLPKVAETARRYMGDKGRLIYDHQKAATDIPQTGKNFAGVMKRYGIDTVILFPLAGPETQRAWTYRALEQGLNVIVGAAMTHPAFLHTEGGYILDSALLEAYRIAARAGIDSFVVPGTKPTVVELIANALRIEGMDAPVFFSPGFGKKGQGGKLGEIKKVLGNNWHAIVGSDIYKSEDYAKAAQEVVTALLRET